MKTDHYTEGNLQEDEYKSAYRTIILRSVCFSMILNNILEDNTFFNYQNPPFQLFLKNFHVCPNNLICDELFQVDHNKQKRKEWYEH
jgi:hypothetical protein